MNDLGSITRYHEKKEKIAKTITFNVDGQTVNAHSTEISIIFRSLEISFKSI